MTAPAITAATPATLPRERARREVSARECLEVWYLHGFGWAAAPGGPALHLATGVCFDVVEVPLSAGLAVLGRLTREETGPVAADTRRMRFLVAPGSAEEVPGLLQWLEWGGVTLDLHVQGAGGRMPAPALPGEDAPWEAADRTSPAWVRPPSPGQVGTLPSVGLSEMRGAGSPDLARLVATAAVECHRSRLFPLSSRVDRYPRSRGFQA